MPAKPYMVWVLYDIQKNKIRTKVSKICKQLGLERVQYSAFLGPLPKNRIDELALQCQSLIDEETDRVYIFPFCDRDFDNIRVIGIGFDKDYIKGETLQAFF